MSQQGDAQLQDMIARLRALPDMARAAMPQLAHALEEHVQRTIAAGTDAYGKSWAPRKADGGRALVNAAKALHVAWVGNTVIARLAGVEARHHRGRVRGASVQGGNARRILPVREVPGPVLTAFRAVLVEQFNRITGGGT